jgi:hypothetical protein
MEPVIETDIVLRDGSTVRVRYRVFQLGLPAVLGLIAFRRIRRRLRDADLTAETAARFGVDSAPESP